MSAYQAGRVAKKTLGAQIWCVCEGRLAWADPELSYWELLAPGPSCLHLHGLLTHITAITPDTLLHQDSRVCHLHCRSQCSRCAAYLLCKKSALSLWKLGCFTREGGRSQVQEVAVPYYIWLANPFSQHQPFSTQPRTQLSSFSSVHDNFNKGRFFKNFLCLIQVFQFHNSFPCAVIQATEKYSTAMY